MIVCNLEKLIKQRDITQVELADKLGVSRNTISNYIHNKSKSFSMEHMDKLIEILHCSFDDLFTYMSEEEYEKYQKEQESNSGRSLFMSRNVDTSHLFSGVGKLYVDSSDSKDYLYNQLIKLYIEQTYQEINKASTNIPCKYEVKSSTKNKPKKHLPTDNIETFEDENLHDLKHKVDKFSDDIEDLKEQMSNIIKYIEYSNRD